MRVFGERGISDYFEKRRARLRSEVWQAERNYLLSVNETQYVRYLVDSHRVEPLVLDWDRIYVSQREATFSSDGRLLDSSADACAEGGYREFVVTFHIPYSGETELLECRPTQFIMWSREVSVASGRICFDMPASGKSEELKRDSSEVMDNIRKMAGWVNADVQDFNCQLEREAGRCVGERKSDLLKQDNLVASLGIPLHRAAEVPSTFAIPITPKRVVLRPPAPDTAFRPEPTLDDATYSDILQIIQDTGVAMERLPGVYREKSEETLRDHLLMVLSTHFPSATGETLNRSGRTDILIRHEKSNLFVAECTYWAGFTVFLKKLSQVLRNLTWRDSKAALICFVKRKRLQHVLEQIESRTRGHSCFVKDHGRQSEGWYDFEFHLLDDPSRSVRVAVLCFHFPDTPHGEKSGTPEKARGNA